jgi:polyferredoxin
MVPACVFHCYACPLSTFACPIGVIANFAALHLWPLLVIGVLVAVGGAAGSLVCGWACPFGFAQDLLAKIPVRKFRIPAFLSHTRFLVLIGLVIVLPYVLGGQGWSFEKQGDKAVTICSVCPAGAAEAGVPAMIRQAAQKGSVETWMSWYKTAILIALLVLALFTYRPWCSIFCPLGAILAMFNRFSLFFLRFKGAECRSCNLCRSYCSYGVKVDQSINNSRCIRCLECTTCGAVTPALAPWKRRD